MEQNKKILIGVIIAIIVIICGYFGYNYYFKKEAGEPPVSEILTAQETERESILKSLTAPEGKTEFTEEDLMILKNLSAPLKPKTTSNITDEEKQRILESLSAPK